MTNERVHVKPMPEKHRKLPKIYRPQTPPIFQDCGPEGPTDEDRKLARELFSLLDPESQAWYKSGGSKLFDDL